MTTVIGILGLIVLIGAPILGWRFLGGPTRNRRIFGALLMAVFMPQLALVLFHGMAGLTPSQFTIVNSIEIYPSGSTALQTNNISEILHDGFCVGVLPFLIIAFLIGLISTYTHAATGRTSQGHTVDIYVQDPHAEAAKTSLMMRAFWLFLFIPIGILLAYLRSVVDMHNLDLFGSGRVATISWLFAIVSFMLIMLLALPRINAIPQYGSSLMTYVSRGIAVVALGALVVGLRDFSLVECTTLTANGNSTMAALHDSWITYTATQNDDQEIYRIRADGTDKTQLTNGLNAYRSRWSPDGTQIVFVVSRQNANDQMYMMDATGTNQRNLSQAAGDGYAPIWSPDGSLIAFSTGRDGTNTDVRAEIYVMHPNGDQVNRITNAAGIKVVSAWSPNGSRISFYNRGDNTSTIGLVNTDGTNLTPFPQISPTARYSVWMPDGATLLYEASVDGTTRIVMANADGSNAHILQGTGDAIGHPAPSADGNYILFTRWHTNNASTMNLMDKNGNAICQLAANGSYADWKGIVRPNQAISSPTAIPTPAVAAQAYRAWLYSPKDASNQARTDTSINYLAWDGTPWTARLQGNTFIFAPKGDFSQAQTGPTLNYLSWDGARDQWTAKVQGDIFTHAPAGDFNRAHTDTIINYLGWGGLTDRWTAKLQTQTDATPAALVPTVMPTPSASISVANVTGHWTGVLEQRGGGRQSQYTFAMDLTQADDRVTGTSRIELNDGQYAVMELGGSVQNGRFNFEESKVVDPKQSGVSWCIKRES